MRKKWLVGIFLSLISITCISGCGVSYKDYTDIQQTETETEQTSGIEMNREYIMEEDVMKLPSDAVIIDDYSKEGTILTSPHLNYNISIKVNKAILADNMDAYKELGGMMAVNGKNIIIINTMTLIRKTGQTSGKACMAVSVNAILCWMICLN